MEERKLKIQFGKNGNGYTTPRISLPYPWIKKMGINEDNREVNVTFTEDKIIIKKIKD